MDIKCIESLKAIRKRNLSLMISKQSLIVAFPLNKSWLMVIVSHSELIGTVKRVLCYMWEGIPSKLLGVGTSATEGFYVEINLRKRNWLLCCSYNPNKNKIQFHLENLTESLALNSSNYENLIILGDFNASIDKLYGRFLWYIWS